MLNQIAMFYDNSPVNVTLTFDQVDYITKMGLLEAIQMIEHSGDASQETIDDYDALNQSLAYFTTRAEQEQLALRDIPADWVQILVESTLAKVS